LAKMHPFFSLSFSIFSHLLPRNSWTYGGSKRPCIAGPTLSLGLIAPSMGKRRNRLGNFDYPCFQFVSLRSNRWKWPQLNGPACHSLSLSVRPIAPFISAHRDQSDGRTSSSCPPLATS
jgi:hypothetical protein